MDLQEQYKILLKEAVAIKSISTDKAFKKDIEQMVTWLNKTLESVGFSVNVFKEYGNPIIIAKLIANPDYETVLLYGHYDVQPAEKEDGWINEPFELSEDDEKFYARGVMDNKGQFLIYLAAIKNLVETNHLGKNIIFLIEGNEETGSPLLSKLISDHKDLLKADFAVISDGLTSVNPVIEVSFRGNVNSELTIYGPSNALHSGSFGGIVYNPINVLNTVLSKLSVETGKTDILSDAITKPTENDNNRMKSRNYNIDTFRASTGLEKPVFDETLTIRTVLGFNNSVQITGITGGYTGEGFKNAIPTKATAKINFRINFGLDPKDVKSALEKFFKENIAPDIKYDYKCNDLSNGAYLDVDNPLVEKIKKILESTYEQNAVYDYVGGTLPIAYDISNSLKIPAVFTGLANSDSNMHGANENFKKEYINKALNFANALLKRK